MKEIWKDIPNYEGHYQISNFGRVKSLDRYIISKNGRRIFKKGLSLIHISEPTRHFKRSRMPSSA